MLIRDQIQWCIDKGSIKNYVDKKDSPQSLGLKMSTFGLLGGQKGQINERIMKVGNYVDYEWVFLVVKHEAKKKSFW